MRRIHQIVSSRLIIGLMACWCAGVGLASFGGCALAQSGSRVELGLLQVGKSSEAGRLSALEHLSAEITRRTSIETAPRAFFVPANSKDLYRFPLLLLAANQPLPELALAERNALATWLQMGGMLVIDWQGGGADLESFRGSLEEWLQGILPGRRLERISRGGVLYRSFYRLTFATGRIRLVDDLYGVALDDRYAVVVMFNDTLGAVERNNDGNFLHDVIPGGEPQREQAIRLLVNFVVYALCLDYKDDKVHLDYLKSKRNWRLPGDKP